MNEAGSRGDLSQALTHIVSGCSVLTAKSSSGPMAALVSFAQQVGMNPPRIVVSLAKERAVVTALEEAGRFVLNTCAQGDTELRTRFAESRDVIKTFEELGAEERTAGYSLPQASAHLECTVAQRVDIGDHWLYIADVHDGEVSFDKSPLVHVRRSGLDY